MSRIPCTKQMTSNNVFGCLQDGSPQDSRTGYYNNWHFDVQTNANGGVFEDLPFWFSRVFNNQTKSEARQLGKAEDPYYCEAEYCVVQGIFDPTSYASMNISRMVVGHGIRLLGSIPYMRGTVVQSTFTNPGTEGQYNVNSPDLDMDFWDNQWTEAMSNLAGPIVSACDSYADDVTSFWYEQAFSEAVRDPASIFSPTCFPSYTEGLLMNQASVAYSKAVPYNDTFVLPLWFNEETRKIMARQGSDEACCNWQPLSLTNWTSGAYSSFSPLTDLSDYFKWSKIELKRWRSINPPTVLACHKSSNSQTISLQVSNSGPVCQVYEIFQKPVVHLPVKLDYISQFANASLLTLFNLHTNDGTVTVRNINGDGSMIRFSNVTWNAPYLQSYLSEQQTGGFLVVCGDFPEGLGTLSNPYSDELLPETLGSSLPLFYWVAPNRTRGLDQQLINWQRANTGYCNVTNGLCQGVYNGTVDWTDKFGLPGQLKNFYNALGGSEFPMPCKVAGVFRRFLDDPTNQTLLAEAQQYLPPGWHPLNTNQRQWLASVTNASTVSYQASSKTFHSPRRTSTHGALQPQGLPQTLLKNHPVKQIFHDVSFDLQVADTVLKPYYDLKPHSGPFVSSNYEMGLLRTKYPDRFVFPLDISRSSSATACIVTPDATMNDDALDEETIMSSGSISLSVCPRTLPGLQQSQEQEYQLVADCIGLDDMTAGAMSFGERWIGSFDSTVENLGNRRFRYKTHIKLKLPIRPPLNPDVPETNCINLPTLANIKINANTDHQFLGRCRMEIFDSKLKSRLRLAKTKLVDCVLIPIQKEKQRLEESSANVLATVKKIKDFISNWSAETCSMFGACSKFKTMFYLEIYGILPVIIIISITVFIVIVVLLVEYCKGRSQNKKLHQDLEMETKS